MDVVYDFLVSDNSKPEFESTVKASLMLLSTLLQKLSKTSDEGLSGLTAAVSLALYVSHSCDKTKFPAYSFDETMVTLLNLVSTWVDEQFQNPLHIQMQQGTTYRTEENKVRSRTFWFKARMHVQLCIACIMCMYNHVKQECMNA